MSEDDLTRLRGALLKRRREVFQSVRQMEAGWQSLSERDVELEEEAQKADMTGLYDRLDARARDVIETIDLALCRMAAGSYGICEECEGLIPLKRLEAMPEARMCVGCVRKYEKKQKRPRSSRELMPCAALPDEYRGLSDEELAAVAREHLRDDGRVDLDELEIWCRNGIVYLEGRLPGEAEHQIILQILTDVMGLTSVVDLLGSDEVAWQREDRTPGKTAEGLPQVEGLVSESSDYTRDVFESMEEGIPYSPPDGPIQEEE